MIEKFTPGPWLKNFRNDKNMCPVPYIEIYSRGNSFWIAQVRNSDIGICEACDADADLIAAAPKMYKALSDIVLNLGNHEDRMLNALDALESANPEIKNIYKALSAASFKNEDEP